LSRLDDGRHTVRVKAWDTYNNSGEGYTEFVVASDAEMALRNVLNYPNPFTTHTSFQFEHNFAGQALEVQVQVFTVSGRLLKTINETIVSDGFRVDDIEWDGLDDFGDRLGRGVYVYKVTVRADNAAGGSVQQSAFQKLVILR
jgi:flagellar hook assembly protein FlgD